MKTTDFSLGQKLCWVSSRNDKAISEVTVTKVAKKWVYVDDSGDRFDPETMLADGGIYSSPAKIHLSKEDYLARKEIDSEYSKLYYDMQGNMKAKNITLQNIRDARKLLGL